ncbi:MAG TPA: RHS repeat-associated core domain-containing protein [Verrucomicrobiota bacterium]|nr:RHS repeat-associated core domain-containing protein [Verrucomicrobiota bacterium]
MKLLNQYTSRTVPGFVNVLGTVTNTATVSLWSQDNFALYTPTTRQGDYFRGEMLFNNNTGALWLTITSVAALSNHFGADIVTNSAGRLLLAQNPETFIYDADGNLTSDGRWTYTWDAENRLVKLAAATGVGPQISLQFDYDHQGRRIRQRVWNNPTWSGNPTNDVRYVYDGWNLLASLNPASSVRQSYLWGLDLSGTMQGAGGVGGLLAITDASQGSHFCAYDGNGNVTALVKADGSGLAAQYEYGPFGEPLRATGPMAKANPFRFSTKYQDDESDLIYYGYRYYNPSTGRWPNRDPIGERGGMNLYGFVGNSPLNRVDRLGLDAAIINHGGYTGHTSFIIVQSDGSVTAYHFYAKSHQTGRCCELGSLLSVCCDKVSVWQESAKSLQDYMASQEKLGGGAKIVAYAFGTSLDDQLSLEDLNEQDKADAGIYSLALGVECHKKSWDWFNEYLEGGQQIHPTLLPGQQQPPYWPDRWFETGRHRLESLPQVPAPPSPRPGR